MDTPSPLLYILALIALLAFSMFFSAAESAFLSASRLHLRYLSEKNHPAARRVESILKHRDLFLNAILVGNNVVNIATSALITALALEIFGDAGVALATAFATIIILLFGEILPKSVALHWPEKLALKISLPVRVLIVVSIPVVFVFTLLTRAIGRAMGGADSSSGQSVTEDDLRTLIEVGEEEGVIESGKRSMLNRILEYTDLTAHEIMTPRTEIVAVDERATKDEILALHATERYSRYPVYRGNIDSIVGILRIRDVILGDSHHGPSRDITARELAIKPVFAFETQTLASLQALLRAENRNLAVVLDEYGGTAGIITTEDLAEEIFGSIRDEFDVEELARPAEAAPVDGSIVNGSERLSALGERLGIALDSPMHETIAGFIMEKTGDIPSVGMSVIEAGWMFTVAEREGNKISAVRLDRLSGGAQ